MAVATTIFELTSLYIVYYILINTSCIKHAPSLMAAFFFYMEQGGFQFYISLTEELPDEVKTGVAQFERVANVMVYKLNPFTLTGTVPCKYFVYKILSVRMTLE